MKRNKKRGKRLWSKNRISKKETSNKLAGTNKQNQTESIRLFSFVPILY